MKRCGHCHEIKPFSDFHKSSTRAKYDGLTVWCKLCKKLHDQGKIDRKHFAQTLPEALYRFFTPGEPNTCWPWEGGIGANGYGTIRFQNKDYGAHVASWIVHRGPIPDGLCVLHTCDIRHCINYVDHLFLGTVADNSKDAAIKGRLQQKLTLDEARTIKQLITQGHMTDTAIAKQFSVSKHLIYRMKRGLCYKHLT